ncbi:hypothetical protein BS333_17540 [Vibrio azureus]|uniref:Phage tail protein n=1 Tax=Vibrio azureus NBRC 104587 TaxID=1219077 RepID=U3C943_9VIBR|nr:hypothetical protein [Vibrio azureus]AUI88163.1 hypothetical protein BS333_17540 [Vibrio azureus]GAD74943.1 hypothetical protein VAZ01S_017_00380 [Vibrio azureus NBRC 104587]
MSIEQKITDLQTASAEQTAASQALSQEVIEKLGEIDQKFIEAKDSFERWRGQVQAKDIHGQSMYQSMIDLTGLSTDNYYPVWWQFPSNKGGDSRLTISREWAQDQELDPFGERLSVAGLNLQIEGAGHPTLGDADYMTIKRFWQTYRKTVRGLAFGMQCIARPINGLRPMYLGYTDGQIVNHSSRSGCYLRGGLTYHVTKSFQHQLWYSREGGEVSAGTYSNEAFEIDWRVKAYHKDDPFLGPDYDDQIRFLYAMELDKRYVKAQ